MPQNLAERLGPSSAFAAFVALGGNTVDADTETDTVTVASRGGEERYQVRARDDGYVVSSASRSNDYAAEARGTSADDVERYLTFHIGNAAIRSELGLGLLYIAPDVPLARHWEVTHRDADAVLSSPRQPGRTMTLLRGVEGERRTFSHLMDVPLGLLREALLDPQGTPVFELAEPDPDRPRVRQWSPGWVFGPSFREFVALGGFELRNDGDGIRIDDGEVGMLVTRGDDGWLHVGRFSRGLIDPMLRARRFDDVERYASHEFGDIVRSLSRPALPGLTEPDAAPQAAARLEPLGDGWVSVREADGAERGLEVEAGGIRGTRHAVDLTHLLAWSPHAIRESYREAAGSPALTSIRVPVGPRPASPPAVDWALLSPHDRRLADEGLRLFSGLAALSNKPMDAPMSVVPFDGGVAVFRAVRGGGKILVAPDGSALYQSSSRTFDRALEAFHAGERSPRESFGV